MGNRTSGRKEIFEVLRGGNTLKAFNNEYGHQIMLNPVKHFLYQRAYKCDVYNRELLSISQKYNEFMKNKKAEATKSLETSDNSIAAEAIN